MLIEQVKNTLTTNFEHQPTQDQTQLIEKLSAFFTSNDNYAAFILKGYAGTGKTTMVKSIVKTLPKFKLKTILLAPTGRAAKVLSNYSGNRAITIHKKIYFSNSDGWGGMRFERQENKHTNTIFIVDEASMVSGKSDIGINSVLDDLMEYIYNQQGCKALFIGDTAQLPPVGIDLSPALNKNYLKTAFGLTISEMTLQEVMRQEKKSGILYNATSLRQAIAEKKSGFPQFEYKLFPDIEYTSGEDLEEKLEEAYNTYGDEETMVVCRSNKRANLFNQQIRSRIQWKEDDLAAGDFLMVVKNNYFWLKADSEPGFIANGDVIEITKVVKRETMYGFNFATIIMRLLDYPDEPEHEVKVILETISSEVPALTKEQQNQLYEAVLEDYGDIANKRERIARVKHDKWFNALQVKFGYAVTCHKSQGGQWDAVFVDQGYLTEEMINESYLRWLYTAITRAKQKLYLVNFHPKFFKADTDPTS